MKMGISDLLGAALSISALLGTTVCIAASPEETAAARAAAQSGLEAFRKGDCKASIDLFERAESLLHAPSHLLYLARCQEKTGNLVRARELYIKLSRETLAADAPQAFQDAKNAADSELGPLEARIPYLTIVVTGEGASDAEVSIDDTALPKAVVGIPYPINPGVHHVTARTAQGFGARAEAKVVEGARERLSLTLKAGAFPPTATDANTKGAAAATSDGQVGTTEQPAPSSSESTRGSWMKPVGWLSIGVGALSAGFGTYMFFYGAHKDKNADDIRSECEAAGICDDVDEKQIGALRDDAKSAGIIAPLGVGVGVLGIAGGITLLVLAPSKQGQAAIVPWVGPSSLGVSGRF